MSERRRTVLDGVAWPVAATSGLLTVVALVLYARNSAAQGGSPRLYLADVWLGLILPTVGAVLVTRLGKPRLGALLLLGGALSLTDVAGQLAVYLRVVRETDGPIADVSAWLAAWTWTPYLLLPTVLVLLFPTGHVASRGWGRVLGVTVSVIVLATVTWSLAPGPVDGFPGLDNPFGIEAAPWLATLAGALTAVTVVLLGSVSLLAAAWRWRRSQPPERSQLAWFTGAAAFMLATLLLGDGLPYPWADVVTATGVTLVLVVIGLTSQASAAAAELERSRRQLVHAQERERLRLHRDLHDGLGPELAGLALQLGAAARTAQDEELQRTLEDTGSRLQELTREVRHIVQGLRPPSLDDVGLVSALRQQARMLTTADGPRFDVLAPPLPTLPPAVEVAVYRIAVEAMTNVVRHARASRCEVCLAISGDTLALDVRDDGDGVAVGHRVESSGTGLPSMRQRAEEVGGFLSADPGPDGWRVRCRVPVTPA